MGIEQAKQTLNRKKMNSTIHIDAIVIQISIRQDVTEEAVGNDVGI